MAAHCNVSVYAETYEKMQVLRWQLRHDASTNGWTASWSLFMMFMVNFYEQVIQAVAEIENNGAPVTHLREVALNALRYVPPKPERKKRNPNVVTTSKRATLEQRARVAERLIAVGLTPSDEIIDAMIDSGVLTELDRQANETA